MELSKTGKIVAEKGLLLPAYANQKKLRLVVPSPLIGGLMGTGGSTIRRLQQDYQSSIKVSEPRLFHPDAAAEHGRVIHCSALDHDALCRTAVAIIQALFCSFEGPSSLFNLYFVIPAVSARLLAMDGGQVLAQLTSAHKIDFRLRDPHRLAPSERLLAATGPMSVLPAMLSSLLAVFPHPFQYLSMQHLDPASGSGEEHQPQQSVLDLPLNVAVLRYKRKTNQKRADNRAEKRAKHTACRRPHHSDK